MLSLSKTISSTLDSASRRIVKVLRNGKNDSQTGKQVAPYGVDSNPIKGMRAIYAETGNKGDKVVIGYVNVDQMARVGENRTFATDADGELKFYIWQKADGTCEIGGSTKNMVRFQELETGFNQLKADFNALVGIFNSHVHPGVTVGAGSTTPTVTSGSASSASIAAAKIEEIKTL